MENNDTVKNETLTPLAEARAKFVALAKEAADAAAAVHDLQTQQDLKDWGNMIRTHLTPPVNLEKFKTVTDDPHYKEMQEHYINARIEDDILNKMFDVVTSLVNHLPI